jgi:outer membrane protein assembly factor BamB
VLSPRRRPRLFLTIGVVALLLLGAAAAAAYLLVLKRPGDIFHADVPFVESTPTPAPPKPKQGRKPPFTWPMYGFTKDHRRYYGPPNPVKGPWRQVWMHRAPALLEFPPVIYKGAIFQLADNGRLAKIQKDTGKILWKRKLGSLSAASPSVADGKVYVSLLETSHGSGRGRVAALGTLHGRMKWSRELSGRTESSPLLHAGRVYAGSENGTLYAFDAGSGRTIWTYRAAGAIKGSPSLSDDGILYFGDYGGHVHAVRASNGRRVWSSGAARGLLRSGRFYATAAVAFGRVYIGATDGREYSFSAKDGRLAWAHQTGRYVYASAAVQDVPGLGPTVFFGSYDGTFYALDARTGKVRWTHRSGGKISGSATIIGDTVYFADLGRRITIGLHTRDGSFAFRRSPGAYDPIISDGYRLFLTGNTSLTALEPVRARKKRRAAKRAATRAAALTLKPRWPATCRQLAPCGPLLAMRRKAAKAIGG